QKELDEQRKNADEALKNTMTPEQIEAAAGRVHKAFKRVNMGKLFAAKFKLNSDFAGMSWEDQRGLMEHVFGGKTADGRRMGIYVSPAVGAWGKRQWHYKMLGRLVDTEGLTYEEGQDPSKEYTEDDGEEDKPYATRVHLPIQPIQSEVDSRAE